MKFERQALRVGALSSLTILLIGIVMTIGEVGGYSMVLTSRSGVGSNYNLSGPMLIAVAIMIGIPMLCAFVKRRKRN